MNIPDHLSYSAIDLFLSCPLKYKYRYIDQKPDILSPALILGSAFHKAMEANFLFRKEQGFDMPLPRVLDAFDASWTELSSKSKLIIGQEPIEDVIDWQGEDKRKLLDAGLSLVKRYYRDQIPFIEPKGVEEKLTQPLHGKYIKEIVGFLDLITVADLVIDFKTVMYPWNDDRIHWSLQPTVYAYLLNRPIELEFHFVVRNPTRDAGISVRRTERSMKDIDWFSKQLDMYVQQIEFAIDNDFFPASPSINCNYCSYKKPCGYRS